QALALEAGRDAPAELRRLERRVERAAIVEDPDAADMLAGVSEPDGPVAVAQRLPVAEVAQQAEPDVLAGQGLGKDVPDEGGIGPLAAQVVIVGDRGRRQGQAFGDKDGHIRPSCLKLATPSRPTTRWSWTERPRALAAS